MNRNNEVTTPMWLRHGTGGHAAGQRGEQAASCPTSQGTAATALNYRAKAARIAQLRLAKHAARAAELSDAEAPRDRDRDHTSKQPKQMSCMNFKAFNMTKRLLLNLNRVHHAQDGT